MYTNRDILHVTPLARVRPKKIDYEYTVTRAHVKKTCAFIYFFVGILQNSAFVFFLLLHKNICISQTSIKLQLCVMCKVVDTRCDIRKISQKILLINNIFEIPSPRNDFRATKTCFILVYLQDIHLLMELKSYIQLSLLTNPPSVFPHLHFFWHPK